MGSVDVRGAGMLVEMWVEPHTEWGVCWMVGCGLGDKHLACGASCLCFSFGKGTSVPRGCLGNGTRSVGQMCGWQDRCAGGGLSPAEWDIMQHSSTQTPLEEKRSSSTRRLRALF